jgi:putative transposase
LEAPNFAVLRSALPRPEVQGLRPSNGQMGVDKIRRLKQLEEDRKLKQLVADLSLDQLLLQDVLSKKL